MRRRRMHGKRRRRSSCKPSPLKSNHEAVADPEYVKRQMELDKEPGIKQGPGYRDLGGGVLRPDADPRLKGVSTIQKVQSGITGLEFVEGPVGTIAGGVNALISGGRGIYHAVRGDTAESASNFLDAKLSIAGIAPVVGNIATTTKTAKAAKALGRFGALRHGDNAIDIVSGGKTDVGNFFSPEVDIIKKATK